MHVEKKGSSPLNPFIPKVLPLLRKEVLDKTTNMIASSVDPNRMFQLDRTTCKDSYLASI